MDNDLIRRSELIKALEPYRYAICGFEGVLDLIDNAPTIHHPNCDTCEGLAKQYSMGFQDGFLTGKERPQGEWYYSYLNGWHCSICHESVKDMPTVMGKANFAFCPNCGADMRKGGAE